MIIVPSNVGGLPKVEYDIKAGTGYASPAHSAGDLLFAVLWNGVGTGEPWLNNSWTPLVGWASDMKAAFIIATNSNAPGPASYPKGEGVAPNGWYVWNMKNAKSISYSDSSSSPYTLQDSSGKSAVLLATAYNANVTGQPQTSPWDRTVDYGQPGFYWLVNTQVSQTPDVPTGVTLGFFARIFEFKNA